ncbi:unnamed protein product, partial [Gongylonema pulchrum]|uniref:Secreted protein n=1 Tax=Gongylonema pulchrum TaxID=637853 RepID=A0A183DML0_9BILA
MIVMKIIIISNNAMVVATMVMMTMAVTLTMGRNKISNERESKGFDMQRGTKEKDRGKSTVDCKTASKGSEIGKMKLAQQQSHENHETTEMNAGKDSDGNEQYKGICGGEDSEDDKKLAVLKNKAKKISENNDDNMNEFRNAGNNE